MLFLVQSSSVHHDAGSLIVNTETQKLECVFAKKFMERGNLIYNIKICLTDVQAGESHDSELIARERLKVALKVFNEKEENIDAICDSIIFKQD